MAEETEHKTNTKSDIADDLRLYIEKRVELFALTIAEQVSAIAANTIQKMIGILLLAGAAFFAWFALGFFVGEWLNSIGFGFLIVSVPLFIAGYIFLNMKSVSFTDKIQSEMIVKTMDSMESGLNVKKKEEASSDT
ncbi:MAG: hypothetical protein EA390_00900 [Balneolaceae bacterium]|nr:MAG: hypothetical protein EA390_00900 [Balneolaceae bacterium]